MSKRTPHFFVLGIPKETDRCPNSVYFVRSSLGVSMYVTDSNKKVFPVAGGSPGAITNLVSPQGTISIELNGQVTEIDISQSILDEIDAIRNAIVQPPNYIPPSASITFGNPTTVEAGTNLARIVNTSFTQNDAGQVNNIKIFRGSTLLVDQDTNQNTLAVGDNFTIGRETVTHSCQISYGEGITKQNNLGLDDPTGKIQAGTITANRNIVGRLKIFYGSLPTFPTTGQEYRDSLNASSSNWSYENTSQTFFQASSVSHIIAVPIDKNINNINITTSSFENITSSFLSNQELIEIPDQSGILWQYRVLKYITNNNYNVQININF